jgi:hypothetical protein
VNARAVPVQHLHRKEIDTLMQYITILGRTSEVNDASYTDKRSGEIVPRTELLLEIPGLRDKVRCELPQTASISQADLERWELEESWVVVEASGFRQMAFARSNARPGESAFGAMLAFQAATVREATADERRDLAEARREAKVHAKELRAKRQAERQAERQAQQANARQSA